MFPLLPKGDQIKLLKFFWLKIFSVCHRCRWHRWQTLSCEYLRKFSEKFKTVLMEYSGAGGNWFMKRTRSKKSRDTVPLMVAYKSKRHHTFFGTVERRYSGIRKKFYAVLYMFFYWRIVWLKSAVSLIIQKKITKHRKGHWFAIVFILTLIKMALCAPRCRMA